MKLTVRDKQHVREGLALLAARTDDPFERRWIDITAEHVEALPTQGGSR